MYGKDYNCFIAGLPDIALDDKKMSLSLADFRSQSLDYVAGKDRSLLDLFFLPNDNVQLLRLLRKQEPDPSLLTVYSAKFMEDEMAEPVNLPSYMIHFINDFKEELLPPTRSLENELSERYYAYMINSSNKFVREYATFIMNLRNLITAINCRKYKMDVDSAVLGDNEFAIALKTSGMKDFGLAMDYPWVERVVILMDVQNLVERERGIDILIWDMIEDAVIFEYFSIDRVIAFLLKLMIVERWSKLDNQSGREVFMELVQRFREEFAKSENKQTSQENK
ncbi:MAG: DUF2764 family protein [Marinifilaceae bacterium]